MNKLNNAKRSAVVAALVEGNSLRSTVRLTGVSMPTTLKLLMDMGAVCERYQDAILRNLPCKRIECDEIWSYVGAKARNLSEAQRKVYGRGDVWTWVGICADTKLVPSWLVGTRNAVTAYQFMKDLAGRLTHRVQLTTDNHKPYLAAVEGAFGIAVDYAVLQKMYGVYADRLQRRRAGIWSQQLFSWAFSFPSRSGSALLLQVLEQCPYRVLLCL